MTRARDLSNDEANGGGATPPFVAGKNKIINGNFLINQRAFSSTTTAGAFTFDRFVNYNSDGTVTLSAQTFTLGAAPVAGYEAKNFLQIVSSGQTATSAAAIIIHKVEGVRTFAGETTTFSFWAKASSGTPKVAIEVSQNFGNTGGSAVVNTYGGQVTLSTSWARYSVTVSVPAITGKTIGTSGDDSIQVAIWTSSGSDTNSRTGSLGIQSTTVQTWGWQWESGSVATPFTPAGGGFPGAELALCQRYFYRRNSDVTGGVVGWGGAYNTTNTQQQAQHPVTMRVVPSFSYSGLQVTRTDGNRVNFTSISNNGISTTVFSVVTSGSTGLVAGSASALCGSGTSTTDYIEFSAEL